MVGSDGTPTLGDQRRVGDLFIVAYLLNRINHCVSILLESIIDTTLIIRIACLIVDAKATAHIQVLHRHAALEELSIHLCDLLDRLLDDLNVGQLTAQMKMQ